MNYHRMPGPPPGRFSANPFGALAPRVGMNLANHRFAPTAFSGSDRAFYQNGYESGNDNRRRITHRLRAERAEYKHMRHRPHMHAGFPHLGGYSIPGQRPFHLPGLFNHAHVQNHHMPHIPHIPYMRPRQQRIRLPMPRRQAPYRVRMPIRRAPHGFQQQPSSYFRRSAYPMYLRGCPPRPPTRRPAYTTSLFSAEYEDDDSDNDDDNEGEDNYSNRMRPRRRQRDIFNDSDDDDDNDNDEFSTSSIRGFPRYSRRSNRRFDTEWSEDEEEEEDDDDDDEWDRDSHFGMGSHRGPHRYYGDRYYTR
jgi:hypothetical protein